MKSRLALLLLSALAAFGRDRIAPTQAMLDADLASARAAWGEDTEISRIEMGTINSCDTVSDAAGWFDFAKRTIQINSNCVWDAELLRLAVWHEYGHAVLGSAAHSLDRKSVMYFQLRHGETITPEDRARLVASRERERPTLRQAK